MSKSVRVHNPRTGEIVYDVAGHIVAGCSSVQADLSDPVTGRLVALGRLIIPAEAVVTTKTSGKTASSKSGEK